MWADLIILKIMCLKYEKNNEVRPYYSLLFDLKLGFKFTDPAIF